jgi:hypothetical protein
MSKKATLPRLHIGPNYIRSRYHNRSIDLFRDDKRGGATLRILNAKPEHPMSECVTVVDDGRMGLGYVRIGLSDEALDALEQALLLRRQEWKHQQKP